MSNNVFRLQEEAFAAKIKISQLKDKSNNYQLQMNDSDNFDVHALAKRKRDDILNLQIPLWKRIFDRVSSRAHDAEVEQNRKTQGK